MYLLVSPGQLRPTTVKMEYIKVMQASLGKPINIGFHMRSFDHSSYGRKKQN